MRSRAVEDDVTCLRDVARPLPARLEFIPALVTAAHNTESPVCGGDIIHVSSYCE